MPDPDQGLGGDGPLRSGALGSARTMQRAMLRPGAIMARMRATPEMPGRDETVGPLLFVPVAILLGTGLYRPAAGLALLVLIAGLVLMRGRGVRMAAAWAAPIPAVATYTWGLLPPPSTSPWVIGCDTPLSAAALWRLFEASVVLGLLLILVAAIAHAPVTLALRPFGRRIAAVALFGALVPVPLALILGKAIMEPFFGPFDVQAALPGAILPALVFALSNGTMEEAVYRGALLGWGATAFGFRGALILQAVAFGFAHLGPDLISPWPVAIGMGFAGLAAGYIVRRTGSLLIPIAVHVGFDIPLYYFTACQLA